MRDVMTLVNKLAWIIHEPRLPQIQGAVSRPGGIIFHESFRLGWEEGMSRLLEQTEINGMRLANRFVRSATWEGMASADGSCTPKLIDLTAKLAQGGVGLIISSYAYVVPEGKARVGQIGIYKDELKDGLQEMTGVVHEHGARIVAQIMHGGIYCDAERTGRTPLALSRVPDLVESPHEEMSMEDIQNIVEAFGQAARRAKEAGFDGVQIHAAHAYLHSQMLSPAFNRRTDAYGGSIENRACALLETLHAIRSAVGPNFPVLIKMNCQDFLDGGLTLEDSLQVAVLLEQNGIDAIELSGGTLISGDLAPVRSGITSENKEAYFREEARAFKERLQVPLILVGGIRSFNLAEQLVEKGYADYISMSRPFVREPDLIKRWASGDRRKSACMSDSLCREPAFSGEGIYCVVERKIKEKS
jgi:2,4-dienoyl-CoA reductase-like NADH-dependent reductase (Old Yellow Enzyme family)